MMFTLRATGDNGPFEAMFVHKIIIKTSYCFCASME